MSLWSRYLAFRRRLIAFFHLSDRVVCEESKGARDYHDWRDGDLTGPWHLVTYRCRRCGKEFEI